MDALFCKLLQRSHPEGMAEVGCSKPASFMQVSTRKAPEDDLAQEMTQDPHGAAARAADWHNPDAISPGGTHARLSLLTRKLTMTMTKGGTIARASTRGQIAR